MHCNIRFACSARTNLIDVATSPRYASNRCRILPLSTTLTKGGKDGLCHDQVSGDGARHFHRHGRRSRELSSDAGIFRTCPLSALPKTARMVRPERLGVRNRASTGAAIRGACLNHAASAKIRAVMIRSGFCTGSPRFIRSTFSIPSVTSPQTVYWPSRKDASSKQMKN